MKRSDPMSRFEQSCMPEPNTGCTLWIGNLYKDGYGQFFLPPDKKVRAHRFIWEFFHGPIPEEKEIDHKCNNRMCVNVVHLQLLTHRENIARSIPAQSRKTHCPQGHPYNELNTYYLKSARGNHRTCRECRRTWNRIAKQIKRREAKIRESDKRA